jgi:asparagine synthase (glutamine-hydrolysing)
VSGPTVSGEARLDNRDDLFRALDVDSGERARTTDLMLILRAYERWGETCATKLLGDFAFVVHDDRRRRSFGARDHLGVKPFYYRASERGLSFATRASLIPDDDGLPLELDEARVADLCIPELECLDLTSTFYHGVWRLPPGHRLTFAAGRVAVAPYWTPDASREIRLGSDAAYVEAFREIFTEAIRCRLAGPAASMLSGGLDSSAIVGFARMILQADGGPALTTLSAMTDDPGCEESRHIRAVLDLPGLDPIAIGPDDVGAFRGRIDAFVASMEEPFDGSMWIPLLLYSAARRRGFGAVLDGVDGDAVASHEPGILAHLLRSGAWGSAIREARGFARFYSGTYEPWSAASRLLAVNAVRAFAPRFVRVAALPFRRRRGVRAAVADSIISPDFALRIDVAGRLRALWAHRSLHPARPPRERQAREIAHPQIGAALERYHRVAESQGIEARHPFFDKRVVEFCLALPWDQKVRDGWSKRIVRRASAGLLPDEVSWRRGRWVRLGWRFLTAVVEQSGDFLARELSSDMSELAPYVDVAKVRAQYERYRSGVVGDAETIWTAAVLSSWLRKTRLKRYDRAAHANGPAALPRIPLAG